MSIIGVGLVSLALPVRRLMSAAFLAATAAGTLIHVGGTTLPAAEIVIALSVAVVGGCCGLGIEHIEALAASL